MRKKKKKNSLVKLFQHILKATAPRWDDKGDMEIRMMSDDNFIEQSLKKQNNKH